jgi:C-terminal processing protease CtpA/Prc
VLIRSVEKGSRAEKAGFRAGDIVVKVNGQPVHDTGDFTHALRSGSGSIGISVMRDKREQNLNLTLPERNDSKDSGEMIEEESFEVPEIDASTQIELSRLNKEIAKLRPQMELASEEVQKSATELRKSCSEQQKKLRQQARKMREEIQPQIRLKLKQQQEQLRIERQKMQREMRGQWLDI